MASAMLKCGYVSENVKIFPMRSDILSSQTCFSYRGGFTPTTSYNTTTLPRGITRDKPPLI